MPRPYEIMQLTEHTDAWWDWRRTGIGSSDAATALDHVRSKTIERLLQEKQGARPNTREFGRARSLHLERAARAEYILLAGVTVAPCCVQSIARPWQRASLDGLSADGSRAVEIKCGRATYQSVTVRRRPFTQHYAQLQHILSVTGLDSIDYWCYCPPHRPVLLPIARDAPFIERLLAAEESLWKIQMAAQLPP